MQPLTGSLLASMGGGGGGMVGHVHRHFRILLWIVGSWGVGGGVQVHILPRG